MKFFIPLAESNEQQTRVYSAIKEFLAKGLGAKISDRSIFKLHYRHDGNKYYAEVGQNHELNNELIVAILLDELRNVYLICTETRGVVRGTPILVGEYDVLSVVDFDL